MARHKSSVFYWRFFISYKSVGSQDCRQFFICVFGIFFIYFYHMAKHFINGGCGIKPFIDLWVIKNKVGFDEEKAQKMLQESGLLAFYERSIDLMSVWFEGKPHNSVTQEMEDYILQGGVYGTLEQQLAMSQNKKGGKFRHLLSKIFLSYEQMKVY